MLARQRLLTPSGAFRRDWTPFEKAELVDIASDCTRLSRKPGTWPGTADELSQTGLDAVREILVGNGTLKSSGQQNQLAELAGLIQPLMATGFGDETVNQVFFPQDAVNGQPAWATEDGSLSLEYSAPDGRYFINNLGGRSLWYENSAGGLNYLGAYDPSVPVSGGPWPGGTITIT